MGGGLAAGAPRDDLRLLDPILTTQLLAAATLREHARGAVLEHDDADTAGTPLRLVSSGLLALLAHDPDPRPVALFGPGQAILPIRPMGRWTLTALGVSNVHDVPDSALAVLVEKPTFTAWHTMIAEASAKRSLDLIAAMGTPDAGERLVRLVQTVGTPMAAGRYRWPLTQAQFAALAGLSRAHLNARLADLRKQGRLAISDRVAETGATP